MTEEEENTCNPPISDDINLKDDESIHLLISGNKTGPITVSEVRQQLQKGQLLFTDLFSVDDGKHWIHLFKINAINNKSLQRDKLPQRPNLDIFVNSDVVSNKGIAQKHEEQEGADAIADLAFLESAITSKEDVSETEINPSILDDLGRTLSAFMEESDNLKKLVAVPTIVGALALSIYYFNDVSNSKSARSSIAESEQIKKGNSRDIASIKSRKRGRGNAAKSYRKRNKPAQKWKYKSRASGSISSKRKFRNQRDLSKGAFPRNNFDRVENRGLSLGEALSSGRIRTRRKIIGQQGHGHDDYHYEEVDEYNDHVYDDRDDHYEDDTYGRKSGVSNIGEVHIRKRDAASVLQDADLDSYGVYEADPYDYDRYEDEEDYSLSGEVNI